MSFTVSKYHHLTAQSYGYLINELARIDSCLCDYFTAVTFLFITDRLARSSLSDGLLDILITIIGHFGGKRRYCNQLSSELLLLSEAVILTKDVNNSRSTVQQTDFELYKAYLCRVLRCTCEDSESNYCLANNYLAVLYYTSGQYKTSIDHCILVIRSQYHSQCSSHSVQGDLLSNVDDDIDITLGLAVFYQYVRTSALNQQQTQYVVNFTTELLAHYMYIRCLLVMKYHQFSQMSPHDEVQRHVKYILDLQQLHVADMLLLKSIKKVI